MCGGNGLLKLTVVWLVWQDFCSRETTSTVSEGHREGESEILAYAQMFVNWFLSSFVWCCHMMIAAIGLISLESFQRPWHPFTLLWHEAARTFAVVNIIREWLLRSFVKYCEVGSFDHLLFVCFLEMDFVWLSVFCTGDSTRIKYLLNTQSTLLCHTGSVWCLILWECALHLPSRCGGVVLWGSHHHWRGHANWLGHQGQQVSQPCELQ